MIQPEFDVIKNSKFEKKNRKKNKKNRKSEELSILTGSLFPTNLLKHIIYFRGDCIENEQTAFKIEFKVSLCLVPMNTY